MAFHTGETVGDYEIIGVLGSGGMGRVFRVRNLLSDRIEAMKIVLPDAASDAGLAERFLREIKVHASLEHPNIAAMRTALRAGDRIVMVMELVEGASLAEVLRRGPLAIEAARSYAGQTLSALAYAHAHGVVHRDVKPANIMVTPGGIVKVTDFGIARAGGSERLTMTGQALGSLYYMSPEQIRGAAPDARSDIYSLGVTLYEMVTGVQPIRGGNEYAIMHGHLTEEPTPPAQLIPAVTRELSGMILKAMAKDPEQRFQTAEEFRAALLGAGEALPAPLPSAGTTYVLQTPVVLDPEQVTRVETHLIRAVGPIGKHLMSKAVKGAASIDDLCRQLAKQVPDEREREAFLRSCTKSITATRAATDGQTGQGKLSPDVVDAARRKLAPFIGPLAKILVDRTARKARTTEEFYSLLAAQIPSEHDRASFLSSIAR